MIKYIYNVHLCEYMCKHNSTDYSICVAELFHTCVCLSILLWICTNSALFPQLLVQKWRLCCLCWGSMVFVKLRANMCQLLKSVLAVSPAGWQEKEGVIINFYFIFSLLGNWQHPICFCMLLKHQKALWDVHKCIERKCHFLTYKIILIYHFINFEKNMKLSCISKYITVIFIIDILYAIRRNRKWIWDHNDK